MSNPGPKATTRRKPTTPAAAAAAADTAAALEADRGADEPAPITTDEGELRADVAALLEKLRNVRAQAKDLSDEEKDLLADVRAAVREGRLEPGEYTHGGRKVLTMSWGASFDEATARQQIAAPLLPHVTKRVPDGGLVDKALADGVITAEQHAAITREVIDPALAKDNLPPALYRKCLVRAGNPTIKAA